MAPLAPSKLKLSSKPQRPLSKSKPMLPSAQPASKPVVSASAPKHKAVVVAPPTESDEEEETHLQGFSSDEDSSDEDDGDDAPDIPGVDIGKLPTIAKDDATVRRKLEKAKREPVRDRLVPVLHRFTNIF
jgi:nucleolar protein 15